MTIKGIFFDLGGTLFSYRNVAQTNVRFLLEATERLKCDESPEAIKQAYGKASKEIAARYAQQPYYLHVDLFNDMFVRFVEFLDVAYDPEVHEWYRREYDQALFDCLEIKADCIGTLSALKAKSLYLSICSNIDEHMLTPLVTREALHDYLDHWTSSEAARSCKPHRGIFDVCLEKSGLNPSEVLFVGDSPEHDIAGAAALGMRTALVTDGGMEPPLQTKTTTALPDHVIGTLAELSDLI
ncbi:MAG: HAD family hydrolase [Pseudomonadota bacterium]